MKQKYPIKLECPICGYHMNFVISKEATLKSLEDMNWKQKVREEIIKSLSYHKDQQKLNREIAPAVSHHHEIIIDFIENELKERLKL